VSANYRDWGNHLNLIEFCYNSTKHSTIGANPFKLALGVEARKPMQLTIVKFEGYHCEGGKIVVEMVKMHKS
jgi:hypothetical protein